MDARHDDAGREQSAPPRSGRSDTSERGRAGLLSGVGIAGRVGLVLFATAIVPMIAALVALETGLTDDPAAMLGMGLAIGLGLLAPISRVCASVIVLRDLRALNEFCSDIQRGRYGTRLPVGLEADDEHEMLRLKRNMNWMAHHIHAQTRSLRARLDESDLRKRFYEEMSYRDPLTGLHNRRYFERFLADLLRRPGRQDGIFLALIDCDRFNGVNDALGHQTGDDVLACLGRVIRESVREGVDVGFRFGGDEFGVIFRDIEFPDCRNACDRIRTRFAVANGHGCTVSIGLQPWIPAMGPEAAALVRACDVSLYQAKGRGGDVVVASSQPGARPCLSRPAEAACAPKR